MPSPTECCGYSKQHALKWARMPWTGSIRNGDGGTSSRSPRTTEILADCVAAAGLEARLLDAADDERWDLPIRRAMEVASAFGGPKTQTPAIVVRSEPPHGFKGPVMAPAPTGPFAVELWDAIQVLSQYNGFFEITRPRAHAPRDHLPT